MDTGSILKIIDWWRDLSQKDFRVADWASDFDRLFQDLMDTTSHPYYMALYSIVKAAIFYVTEAQDFGLCPPYAKAGDEVFVGHGCRVPFILRRQHSQVAGSESTFQMIGPCHLNGWMQGKAVHENTVWEEVAIV